MKIIFCYTDVPDPRVEAAMRKYAPEAKFIDTSKSIYDYNKALVTHWGLDDLVVIEHDKEITSEVIPSFTACDEPWCVYSYMCYPEPYQRDTIHGLGCTKYSLALQKQIDPFDFCGPDPEWLYPSGPCRSCNGQGCWRGLDTRITLQILNKCISFTPHVHGRIEHHHTYPDGWKRERGLE